MSNINKKDYWNDRFISEIWHKGQEQQTKEYARANVEQINIGADFTGTITDFGCALGDAIPIYAKAFPKAKILGIDIAEAAITKCRKKYGTIADFLCGDHTAIFFTDVIITSHVMEHISNDKYIIKALIEKCNDLFVFVPYKEYPLYCDHVNYYDEFYYDDLPVADKKIFNVCYNAKLPLFSILKNILRFRLSTYVNFSKDRIMFHFKGVSSNQI